MATVQQTGRAARLLSFLENDAANPRLLADAAEAAFAERDVETAADLLARLEALGPLPPPARNLAGLVALAQERFRDAADHFAALMADGVDDPGIRFNRAWAHAMLNEHDDALALLDEASTAISPHGPKLRILMLHHLGDLARGLEEGRALAADRPDDQPLLGTLATLALDAEDAATARAYAERAPDDSDALATLGMLTLGDQQADDAVRLLDRAIERQPDNARAWVGKGLALLQQGEAADAATALDRGATLFGDHLGSWISSGWAHVVAGDRQTGRNRFERALALDDTFAEAHGGLAVVDILDGETERGRQGATVARRLDPTGLGGQLAEMLLLEQAGDRDGAERIVRRALRAPAGAGSQSIGDALAGLARRRR